MLSISIITPSYNQNAFLPRTLLSVETQDYPSYEHIIFDGCSTDGSQATLLDYANRNSRARVYVESDDGQVSAINKGLAIATGDIVAWINSDDYYASSDVFDTVAKAFNAHPNIDLIYGAGNRIDQNGKFINRAFVHTKGVINARSLFRSIGILQPSVFFRRTVYKRCGGLDPRYNLQLDYEYWIRLLQNGCRFMYIPKILSNATAHRDAKSTAQRGSQLAECLSLIFNKYQAVPLEWINRYAEFRVSGKDQKINKSISLTSSQVKKKQAISNMLYHYYNEARYDSNLTQCSRVSRTRIAKETGPIDNHSSKVVITSFDSLYYSQGINLIASLHRTSLSIIDKIIVYDLGLTSHQRHQLELLERVHIADYPVSSEKIFNGYLEPRHRAYKPMAIRSSPDWISKDDLVLWMDAGLSALNNIDVIFRHIDNDGFFIADHDDKESWPFYNINFMHPEAQNAFNASNRELLAHHLCSCLIGYRAGGEFQKIIDDAFEFGKDPRIVLWPKSPPKSEKYKPHLGHKDKLYRKQLLDGTIDPNNISCQELRRLFDYYGHRTQSIYSILCFRNNAPVFSGKTYRRSNAMSSQAATNNWLRGANVTQNSSSRENLQNQDPSVVVYHHRGVYNNLDGLRYRRKGEVLFILGNGPSLRNFPFERTRQFATLGMNAAYRFWDKTQIYPTYYCCLDTVVLESHRKEIRRLIRQANTNGIQYFFVRELFLDWYPELKDNARVISLESCCLNYSFIDTETITTGSFSILFGVLLGYRQVYISGIDLQYIEKLPEASVREATKLEITKDPKTNPNYFFDDYQRKGDRYNPPNRHPGMHLRSWEKVANRLLGLPIEIKNLNPHSAVRCFPFDNIKAVLEELERPFSDSDRVAAAAEKYLEESQFWRQVILKDIAYCNAGPIKEPSSTSSKTEQSKRTRAAIDIKSYLEFFPCKQQINPAITKVQAMRPSDREVGVWDYMTSGSTAGRTVIAALLITTSSPISLKLSIRRRGNSLFEGTSTTTHVANNTPCLIKVMKEFRYNHGYLRIHLSCPTQYSDTRSVIIKARPILISESIDSFCKQTSVHHLRVRESHQLFQSKKFSLAILTNLAMFQARGLQLYADNVIRSARHLQLPPPTTMASIQELLASGSSTEHRDSNNMEEQF